MKWERGGAVGEEVCCNACIYGAPRKEPVKVKAAGVTRHDMYMLNDF